MFKFILCAFLFISLNTYAAYQPITTVSGSVLVGNDINSPVPVNVVSGSLTIATGALATSAKQDTGNSSLSSINSLLNIYLPSIDSNTSTFYALTNTQLRADHLNVSATQIGSWGSSITGVSTTTAMPVSIAGTLVVSQTGNSTVNQGTSPWITSLASTTISSGTVALGSGSNLIGNVGISGQPLVSIGAVSTTASFNGSITGVSTTQTLPVSIGAGSSFSISGVSTTSPMVVNQGTSPWLVSGTIAINPNQTILSAQSGSWSMTANAGTNLNTSTISGTVAFNPNQSILSITSDYTSTATVSSTDAINTSFTFRLANTARTGFEAINTTDATCWLKLSATAATSTTSTVILLPLSGYYNMPKPIYTGQINAICSANGTTGKLNNTEKP